MTKPLGQSPANVERRTSAGQRVPAHRPSAARWGPWLLSLLVATGAILTATINGSSGATQIPSVIQIGAATATVPGIVATTTPPTISSSTTTTSPATQHLTTVVHPQATVTDHEDPKGSEHTSETTAPGTPSGNP